MTGRASGRIKKPKGPTFAKSAKMGHPPCAPTITVQAFRKASASRRHANRFPL